MSDDIRCDVCGKEGRRRMFRHCPDGWLYGESPDEDNPKNQPWVVAVCSRACADRFWCEGPGDLRSSPAYVTETGREGEPDA